LRGWYIRGSNQAPLIVLCHGYGTNRTEVLSLASRLRDYGYNVFLYNQRGHGNSGQMLSSLGLYETEDLRLAIDKLVQRPEVDFSRIGLYGSSLGAYAALRASQGNPNIRALALDSIYPSIASYIDMKVQRVVGFRTSLLSFFVTQLYKLYFRVPSAAVSSEFKPADYQGKTILFITGGDRSSASLAKETRRLYSEFTCRKEIINLANSRESLLYGDEKRRYDQFVLDFFKKELPVIEEPVRIDLETSSQ
jgi:pimeloyl-ACP methyl ester carboxylesterase